MRMIQIRRSGARFVSQRLTARGGLVCGVTVLLAMWVVILPGCGVLDPGRASELEVTGGDGGEAGRLTGRFDKAYYAGQGSETLTFVLLDGPSEAPRQAAIVRMFWMPQAGRTPLARAATNATVLHMIFPREGGSAEVGVYAGAGFLYPGQRPGGPRLTARLWEAAVQLADRSDRFTDLLGQATLSGRIRATYDPPRVRRLLHQLNAEVNETLGYPRMVESDRPLAVPQRLVRQARQRQQSSGG